MWRIFSTKSSYRWSDILPDLMYNYNYNIHGCINAAPASVNLQDEERLKKIHSSHHTNKKRGKVKFKEVDCVLIS